MWTIKKAKWNVSQTYEISSTDPCGKEPIDMFDKRKPLGQKSLKGNWTDLLFVRFKTGQSDFFTTRGASWNQHKMSVVLLFCRVPFLFSLSSEPLVWCLVFGSVCGRGCGWPLPLKHLNHYLTKSIQTCSSHQCKTIPPCFGAPCSWNLWQVIFFFLGLIQSAVSLPSATIVYIFWDESSILTL